MRSSVLIGLLALAGVAGAGPTSVAEYDISSGFGLQSQNESVNLGYGEGEGFSTWSFNWFESLPFELTTVAPGLLFLVR